MSHIPQRHFPKDSLSQQGKSQTSLHVSATRSRDTGARHRHTIICKSSLLKWKHWPSTEGGAHGPRPEKLMRFVFDLLLIYFFCKMKVFPKWKYTCFWKDNAFL